MGRIAVDIALLPNAEMSERAISINAQLVRDYGSPIVLSKDDCLPHVSLAMGCIEADRIGTVGEVLSDLATEHPVGELVVTGIATTLSEANKRALAEFLSGTP